MIRSREYGTSGAPVILLHGGPAAAGYTRGIAMELADHYRIWEPVQRGSSAEPLTVSRHVADLRALVQTRCPDPPPILVGLSWGAMLALCAAAEHPQTFGPLVLVGCGTFDLASRRRMQQTLDERIDDSLQRRLDALRQSSEDADGRLLSGDWSACSD